MAIKIKREPIPLDEDEEDEEALRLAALQSLKLKQALKPAASAAIQPSATACRPAAARPSGPPPPYRAAPPYRPLGPPSFRHRHPRPPFAAHPPGFRGAPLEAGFQRHVMNPNLISIVPVSDKPEQDVSHQKQGQRLQAGYSSFSKQTNVSSSVCPTAEENATVPSKFSRIDASDSESDDDLLTKKKAGSEDEADDGDNDPDDTKNESDQSSSSEDDDSLEKLMEEMEQEMNRDTSDVSKTTKPSSKKTKKLKEKKKKNVPDASKQITPNVIEQKVLNIKKEKEDVEKVQPKPVVKAAPVKVQEPVNNKPVVGIAKPTCIEPLKVKIKQEPIDSDNVVKAPMSNAPKNNILEKVVETSSLSPIRIRSPNEVNSQIETKSTSSKVDETKGKNLKSSPTKATCSQVEKLSPTKSTCSSPVECIERSPVSPITVDSPKSDRTDLLDEGEFSQDKDRSHPPRKHSRSPADRSNSPEHRLGPKKFSRSPSPRTYRTSPGKHVYYHDSVRGTKSNGRTSPFDRFPNKNREQGDRSYSPYYTNSTSHPYNSNYGPAISHYNTYSTSERSRSPFYSSRNYPNSSNHYNDEQNARYRAGESGEPRYPPPALSPRRRSRSPRRLSRSPRRWSRSPRRLSRSPRRLSRSPRRLSRSPRRLSISPRRLSRSPRRLSRSPRRLSPRQQHVRSPRLQSRSPSPKSRSPKRYIPRPSRRRSPWNSRVPNQNATVRRCVSRSPTPHQTRDVTRRSSTSPKKVQHESKRSPGPERGQERVPLSPRKPPHSRSPVIGSPSRAKRASVSPSRTSRRESSPRNFETSHRYTQRSLSPAQAHPESRHRQSSLSPKRKELTFQKDQPNTFRRYSPGHKRQMMSQRRYNHPQNKSRSPPRKTSPLQTQFKNPADKWEQNWGSDYQSSRRAGQAAQPPAASKSLSPPADKGDSNRQRSRSPLRDGADCKSRRRSPPQNASRRQAAVRRRDLVDSRNRDRNRDRRDRRRDGERERVRDRSREKSKVEHDKREKDSENLETGTAKTDQESIQDKEPVINDPVMEARRRKFECNDLVQPVSKKICLKSKNSSHKVTDSPDVTHEEQMTTEANLHTEGDDNHEMKNDGEESDEMLDLDRYDKAYCTTEDVLDLGADNLLWEDDPPDWNRKVEVSVNKPVPAKRPKEKVKDLRSKVSEKRRHRHKNVTDKACSPLVETSSVKKKKKKKETVSVAIEPEPEDEAKQTEQEQSDNQQEDLADKNEECELRDEKIDEPETKDLECTNDDGGDLRAELSRRRAARLTKAGSLHESLPTRLLQSAFQGLIGRNRTDSKLLKSKESKQGTIVQKVQPLPKAEVAFEAGKRRVAEVPSEAGKRRVLLLKRNKPTRKASFQIGLKVTKESDSDSLPSYSEDESEENEDDSLDLSDSDGEDDRGRNAELMAMKKRKQQRARLPVKCRLGSALDRGLKPKRKPFFGRNQVRKSPSVNIDMHAPSSKKKVSIGLKTGKVGKSNKLTLLY